MCVHDSIPLKRRYKKNLESNTAFYNRYQAARQANEKGFIVYCNVEAEQLQQAAFYWIWKHCSTPPSIS
jgi:hypothetical protein